jgi:hypothetical protein
MVYDTPWFLHPEVVEAAALSDAHSPLARPLLGNREFFGGKSLPELAREQGVGPVKDISVFAGGFPEDEDLDHLLAELDNLRGS